MADSNRDKRLSEASSLHDAIESLLHVKADQRVGFIHDRLMSSIDDICAGQSQAKRPFTNDQILALKEISFRIVYILDPMNKNQKGFIAKLKYEFEEKGAIDKVKMVTTVLAFVIAAFSGVYSWVSPLVGSSLFKFHQRLEFAG
jgi:hypothetical protein